MPSKILNGKLFSNIAKLLGLCDYFQISPLVDVLLSVGEERAVVAGIEGEEAAVYNTRSAVSSVLGSLQPPGLPGVPLHSVVGQHGLGTRPDERQPPVPAEHLHPVLLPAQVVVVDPPVGLECGGPGVD